MSNSSEQQRAAEKILEDESLISNLKDDEAKALIDWAMSELESNTGMTTLSDSLEAKVTRIRRAMKEINDLVGNRQSLVADDLEERMAKLLVSDLDPKSQLRLSAEREIAQVTAEKDHIASVELVRRLTQITTKTWSAKTLSEPSSAPSVPSAAHSDAPRPVTPHADPPKSRPIPRPTPDAPKKPGFFERLFGRK